MGVAFGLDVPSATWIATITQENWRKEEKAFFGQIVGASRLRQPSRYHARARCAQRDDTPGQLKRGVCSAGIYVALKRKEGPSTVKRNLECRRAQRLLDVRDKVIAVLDTDAQPHELPIDAELVAPLLRHTRVCHLQRELRQALDATKALREREQAETLQEPLGGHGRGLAALLGRDDVERDHAARREPAGPVAAVTSFLERPACIGAHLRPRELALTRLAARLDRAVEAGVAHVANQTRGERRLLQVARDGERVEPVLPRAKRKRLQAADREERVERRGDGAVSVLQEAEAGEERGRGRDLGRVPGQRESTRL